MSGQLRSSHEFIQTLEEEHDAALELCQRKLAAAEAWRQEMVASFEADHQLPTKRQRELLGWE